MASKKLCKGNLACIESLFAPFIVRFYFRKFNREY